MYTLGLSNLSWFCANSAYTDENEPRQCLRRQLAETRDFSNTSQSATRRSATALGLVLQGVVFVLFLAFSAHHGRLASEGLLNRQHISIVVLASTT